MSAAPGESLAGLIAPTGDDYLRALLGKGDGSGSTYACEGSRNQNDWLVHCASQWLVPWGKTFWQPALDGDYRRSP